MSHRPVVLTILDGWGYREETEHNAVAAASTPVFDRLWAREPHTLLEASGEFVGLPEGQIGNSEIGHTTIGAGTTIDTDLVRISKSAHSGGFASNEAFQDLFAHVKEFNSTLHILGLVSPGGIHSHHDHLYTFLKTAKDQGINKIAIHAFTDGRDVAPTSAAAYLKELELVLSQLGIGHIATVSGRFYAMDRDNNWHRMEKAEQAMFDSKGHTHTAKPSEIVKNLYKAGKVDEHLEPMVFLDGAGVAYPILENDAIMVFNFRSDRVRMLAKRLSERKDVMNLMVATMTQYGPEFDVKVAFPSTSIETTLGSEIAKAGLTQAHIAETEKFPHATYFLNGGRREPHDGEEHVMLESRKDVPTHDLAPKMRAESIADEAIKRIENGVDFIFINFANPDMVGHTANIPALIEALEEVDFQLGRVAEAVAKKGGIILVTADHGNAEVNIDPKSGERHTSHTLNPVPFIAVGTEGVMKTGTLADIAPTALKLLGIPTPAAMTGTNLFTE